jgi:phosphoglycolate phosphatase
MRLPPRLVVFDLDGTLVDSLDDLVSAVNHALAHHRLPTLPPEEVRGYVGDGATKLVLRSLGERVDLLPRVLPTFMDRYRLHLLDGTRPYPGVAETLPRLARERMLAVLTNKPTDMTERILSGLSLAPHFRAVRGGDSLPTKKPDPAGLRSILSELSVSPEETLMVGDSRNAVLAGRGAGTATCGVAWGFGAAGFAAAPPDFLLERFTDLEGLVERYPCLP